MYCIVLPGPTTDHNPLHWGLLGPPLSRVPQGEGPVYTAHPRAPIEASQASWNSASRFLVPRGTGQPHKEQHRDVNEEDGVEHGIAILLVLYETLVNEKRVENQSKEEPAAQIASQSACCWDSGVLTLSTRRTSRNWFSPPGEPRRVLPQS